MTKVVSVTTPRFWWRMPAAEVERWVPVDPDAADGRQRHADRDEQRWDAIASAVAQVGDALALGAWTTEGEPSDHGFVTIEGYPGDLTRAEQEIVAAWFRSWEAVQVDPWFDQLTNGRHRLWATAKHFGERLVPVRGDALGYANAADIEVLGPKWAGHYAKNLEELDALDWFDGADALNASFRGSLVRAASGLIPSPVEAFQPASVDGRHPSVSP